MTDLVEFVARGVLIGAGAAALMDLRALAARRAFNIHGLDIALLGRWIGHSRSVVLSPAAREAAAPSAARWSNRSRPNALDSARLAAT